MCQSVFSVLRAFFSKNRLKKKELSQKRDNCCLISATFSADSFPYTPAVLPEYPQYNTASGNVLP